LAQSVLFLKCVNIRRQLANKVRTIDSTSLKSCSTIAITKTKRPHIPPNLTVSSLCFLHPRVNAIREVGNIKYISVSWNSWDVRKANSIYGDSMIRTGSRMQCMPQAADTVNPKLSKIFCMEINVAIYTIKSSFY
tara:strand:+ start:217 stop:621 length:405 start_codon:yes stop_codon:yes gene_type:complete